MDSLCVMNVIIRHIDRYDTPIADLMPGHYGVSEAGYYYMRSMDSTVVCLNGQSACNPKTKVKVLSPGTVINITIT
jgi:hypothetical protein